jgi:transposase
MGECVLLGTSHRPRERNRHRLGPRLQPRWSRGLDLSPHGRTPPFLSAEQARAVAEVVITTKPLDHGLPGHGWTLKKILRWLNRPSGGSRTTIRSVLKRAGLSWKKCKKLLGKADPARRTEYLKQFVGLYEKMVRGEVTLLYIDESHFHQDLDLGYTWSPRGRRVWRVSASPGLAQRLNWYGAYDLTAGRCLIWEGGRCNAANTTRFLNEVADWARGQTRRVVVIWDGAPCHRAKALEAVAAGLGIELVFLPGYSPDLNPIEGLWKWMREEVTQHHCHASLDALRMACRSFIETINRDPLSVIQQLWPRFDLDPEMEKLRFSA